MAKSKFVSKYRGKTISIANILIEEVT